MTGNKGTPPSAKGKTATRKRSGRRREEDGHQKRSRPEPVKKEYALAEAKAHLSQIIDYVEQSGESIVVTRHGKPVVKLAPERGPGPRKLGFARDRIRFFPTWDEPLTIEDLINE